MRRQPGHRTRRPASRPSQFIHWPQCGQTYRKSSTPQVDGHAGCGTRSPDERPLISCLKDRRRKVARPIDQFDSVAKRLASSALTSWASPRVCATSSRSNSQHRRRQCTPIGVVLEDEIACCSREVMETQIDRGIQIALDTQRMRVAVPETALLDRGQLGQ
jgi:hypothetical protein